MKTLAELVTEWLDVHHGKTRASYQNTIHKFLSFTCVDAISSIQIRHIREWLDSLQEADTTKVKHLNILKAFFSYVTSLEHPPITRSPIPKQFKLPKPKDTLVEGIPHKKIKPLKLQRGLVVSIEKINFRDELN
ncbi:hypothetical protein [Scytonema sp. NUACC21]